MAGPTSPTLSLLIQSTEAQTALNKLNAGLRTLHYLVASFNGSQLGGDSVRSLQAQVVQLTSAYKTAQATIDQLGQKLEAQSGKGVKAAQAEGAAVDQLSRKMEDQSRKEIQATQAETNAAVAKHRTIRDEISKTEAAQAKSLATPAGTRPPAALPQSISPAQTSLALLSRLRVNDRELNPLESAQAGSFLPLRNLEGERAAQRAMARAAQKDAQELVQVGIAAKIKVEKEITALVEAEAKAQALAKKRLAAEAVEIANTELAAKTKVEKEITAVMAAENEKRLAAEKLANRQRALDTRFLLATPIQRARTIAEASIEAHKGGNVPVKFGSEVARSVAATGVSAGVSAAVAGAGAGDSAAHLNSAAAVRANVDAYDRLRSAKDSATQGTQRFTEAQRELHSVLRGTSGALGGLWLTYGSFVPLAAGFAVAATLKEAVKAGAEFEYQLKFIQGITGETDAAMLRLSNTFKDLAKTSLYSATEVAGSGRVLAQAGFSPKQITEAQPSVLKLATAGEIDPTRAAEVLQSTMHAFGLTSQEIPNIASAIAKAAAVSATDIGGMAEAFKQASTIAQQFNVTVSEVNALLAVLATRGIKNSSAGTALANMFRELDPHTNKARDAFKHLGIQVDANTLKQMGAVKVMQMFAAAFAKFDQPSQNRLADAAFNNRGAKQLLAAIAEANNLLPIFHDEIAQAYKEATFLDRVLNALGESTKVQFTNMKNQLGVSLIEAFEGSKDAIQALIKDLAVIVSSPEFRDGVKSMLSGFVRFITFLKDNGEVIAKVAAGIVALRLAVAAYAALPAAAIGAGVAGVAARAAGIAGAGALGSAAAVGATGAAAAGTAGAAGIAAAAATTTATVAAAATAATAGVAAAGVGIAAAAEGAGIAAGAAAGAGVVKGVTPAAKLLRGLRGGLVGAALWTGMEVGDYLAEIQFVTDGVIEKFQGMFSLVSNLGKSWIASFLDGLAQIGSFVGGPLGQLLKNAFLGLADLRRQAVAEQNFNPASHEEVRINGGFDLTRVNAGEVASARGSLRASENALLQEQKVKEPRKYGTQVYNYPVKGGGGSGAASKLAAAEGADLLAQFRQKEQVIEQFVRSEMEVLEVQKRFGLIKEEEYSKEADRLTDIRVNGLVDVARAEETFLKAKIAEGKLKPDAKQRLETQLGTSQARKERAEFDAFQKNRVRDERVKGEDFQRRETVESFRAGLDENRNKIVEQQELQRATKRAEFERSFKPEAESIREISIIETEKVFLADKLNIEKQIAELSKKGDQTSKDKVKELQAVLPLLEEQKKVQAELNAVEAESIYAQSRSFETGMRQAFKAYQDAATDSAKIARDAFTFGINMMESALEEFARTGKINFKSLADSIIAEMAKIAAKAAASEILGKVFPGMQSQSQATGSTATGNTGFAGMLGTAGSAIAGAFGLGGAAPAASVLSTVSGSYTPLGGLTQLFDFHTGGVIGSLPGRASRSVDLSHFAGAKRFHAGGIVGNDHRGPRLTSPMDLVGAPRFHGGGLARDEVPAILQKGEGVFTPAQMSKLSPVTNSQSAQTTNNNNTVNVSVAVPPNMDRASAQQLASRMAAASQKAMRRLL